MKALTLFLSVFLLFNAPSAVVTIPIDGDDLPLGFIDLKEDGFIVKTGKIQMRTTDLNWKLRYFNPDLSLRWEADLTAHKALRYIPFDTYSVFQDILTTHDGEFVYHLEDGEKAVHVSQINREGLVREMEWDKDFIKQIQGVVVGRICSDTHLQFLSVDYGKKNEAPSLVFHRWDHASLAFSRKSAKLPAGENAGARWIFLNHSRDGIWLARKSVGNKKDSYAALLLKLNWDGEVVRQVSLKDDLEIPVTPALHYVHNERTSLDQTGKLSVYTAMKEYYDGNGMLHEWRNPSPEFVEGSETAMALDPQKDRVYVYGYQGKNAKIEQYFVTAFNLEGRKLWSYHPEEDDPVLQERQLVRSEPYQRYSLLLPQANGLRFQLASTDAIHSIKLSDKGQLMARDRHEFRIVTPGHFGQCMPEDSPAKEFIRANSADDVAFYASGATDLVAMFAHGKMTLMKWE